MYTKPPSRSTMRRYSNATILPLVFTVRDTASNAPPRGGLQRSSIVEPELRVPIQSPASHARSPITAFAGVGSGMSSAWRYNPIEAEPAGGSTKTVTTNPSVVGRNDLRISWMPEPVSPFGRSNDTSYSNAPSFQPPR